MKYYKFYIPIYLLFFLLAFFTSCTGQVKTSTPTTAEPQPKLIRTQGANEYSSVSCGLQDKAGYHWFGTSGEGLYRYDGKSFTNFTEKDGLCNNDVQDILEDKMGNLWIGTSAGLCRYDGKTFTKITITVADDQIFDPSTEKASANAQPEIRNILQDKTGKIWFGTGKNGVYCYDPSAQRGLGNTAESHFTHFLHDDNVINKNSLRLIAVTSMLEDKKGNIWFTTWFEGVCRYDPATNEITNLKPFGEVWFAASLEDKSGNLWFGSRGHGAYRYDGKTFTNFFEDTPIFNACAVTAMAEDKAGNLWFGTTHSDMGKRETMGGAWRYNPSVSFGGLPQMTNFTTKDGLSHFSVFNISVDNAGKIWFGTRALGLCRYDPAATPRAGDKAFTDFSDRQSKNIRRIMEDTNENLWFGTNGDGIRRYDPSASRQTGSKSFTYFSTKDGFGGTDVRCMTTDPNGNLWFGSNGGVSKFDGKNFTNFTMKDGLSSNEVWSILMDKTGTLWIATVEGVCRYHPSAAGSTAFTPFSIPEAEQNDFSRPVSGTKLIWDIKEDRAGNIWFATNGSGVYRYDGKSLTNISQQDGLCSNYVNCMIEDKKGNLWFGTQHGGVSRYDPSASKGSSKAFTTFTSKDGLCGNEVWSILEDKTGNLWFLANTNVNPATQYGGVCRYDGKTFTHFTDNEGLLAQNEVQGLLEDKKGVLWLGSSGGLCRFDGKSFINITKEWSLGQLN